MARQRKQNANGTPRGGVEGVKVISAFGTTGNNNTTKKTYGAKRRNTR